MATRSKRVWLTAAALLPLLSACSTDDISGLLFGSSGEPQSITTSSTSPSAPTSALAQANLNRAACGLFFGKAADGSTTTAMETGEISLDRSPQQNLMQAISFDIAGNYENARKLYVWLTASPPDAKVDLDCGQGIKLSGSVNSLAQRRLVALDTEAPEFARSAEIDNVVASATVEPGPELPDPPQVERDRRFYQKGGVVEVAPEDSTTFAPRMNMDMSENTAKLTMVEQRAPKPKAATQSAAPVSQVITPPAATTAPEPMATSVRPVTVPTPSANVTTAAKPAPIDIAPATIAGSEAETDHNGAVVASNSRPVSQGALDIVDPAPDASMIELPISSSPAPARPTTAAAASTPAATPQPTMAAPSGPYYAVQLAAYRSRGRAERAWPEFQSASRGMLNSASHEVVTISIEGKGLFFRLLTGQYATNSDASQACARLKSVGVHCLIRRVTP